MAKPPAKRQLHQVLTTRAGEGAVIGMVREKLAGGVGISLDLSSAPVPDRRFSADAAWIVFGIDLVRILFAQYKVAGPQIEHLVVLRVPFVGVRQFLQSMTGGVAETGRGFLESVGDNTSAPVDKNSIPDQTFTLDANIIVAGLSGREACMDLYNSSPQVKLALKMGSNEFRAEPVARVLLTTRLLMDIYGELSAKENSLPADGMGIEVENA